MKKIFFTATVAAIALSSAPAFAQSTNLVQNGNFASKSTASTNGNFELTSTNKYGSVSNWGTTGGYNLLFNTSNSGSSAGNAYGDYASNGSTTANEYLRYAPASGSAISGNFLALDGDGSFAQAVTQSITGLVAGQSYSLSFDWMASQIESRSGAVTAGILASIGGYTFNTGNLSAPSGVQHATYNFTYTSGATNVLSFLSVGSPVGQPPVALLDNVVLSAVPEPTTWAMMLVGVGMMGASMRLRRRKSALVAA